jgi:hypothetical protein
MNKASRIELRTSEYEEKGYELYDTGVPNITVYILKELQRVDYFYGNSKEPKQYQYKETKDMLLKIDDRVKRQFDLNKIKETNKIYWKEQADLHRANIKEGDLFYTSWGYGQTNIDFFQVISRPTKAKALIRKIGRKIVNGPAFNSCHVKAVKNEFVEDESLTKAVTINSRGNLSSADGFNHEAAITDEDTSHYTSWGH